METDNEFKINPFYFFLNQDQPKQNVLENWLKNSKMISSLYLRGHQTKLYTNILKFSAMQNI